MSENTRPLLTIKGRKIIIDWRSQELKDSLTKGDRILLELHKSLDPGSVAWTIIANARLQRALAILHMI